MNCLIGHPPERCCLHGNTPAWCVERLQMNCAHTNPRTIKDHYETRKFCLDCGKTLLLTADKGGEG